MSYLLSYRYLRPLSYLILNFPVPVYHEQGILGDSVSLPCEISIADGPHEMEDSVVLVLWYREDLGTPIYR